MRRPEANEHAPYYTRYIDLVSSDNILETFKTQLDETATFFGTISAEHSLHRYAPEKWTIREVANHINDSERTFAFRALWFARRLKQPLPGLEQDVCVSAAGANDVPWTNLVEEFQNIRKANISLFRDLPADAWGFTGIASDYSFTVRSLAYIIAGHLNHHCAIIKERYL
jgi:hypothetical protein